MKYGYYKKGINSRKYAGVFSDDYLSENIGFINSNPENVISPIIDDIENPNKWISSLNENDLNEAKIKIEKEYIKNKYQIHRENGWNEYQDFRASVVYDINAGLILEQQAFELENYLKTAYDKINNTGDWKTARFVLKQLTGHPEWMQTYIDQAVQRVDDYILNNYDS